MHQTTVGNVDIFLVKVIRTKGTIHKKESTQREFPPIYANTIVKKLTLHTKTLNVKNMEKKTKFCYRQEKPKSSNFT